MGGRGGNKEAREMGIRENVASEINSSKSMLEENLSLLLIVFTLAEQPGLFLSSL